MFTIKVKLNAGATSDFNYCLINYSHIFIYILIYSISINSMLKYDNTFIIIIKFYVQFKI